MEVASHRSFPGGINQTFEFHSVDLTPCQTDSGRGKFPGFRLDSLMLRGSGLKQVTHDLARMCVDKMVHSGSLLMNHRLYFSMKCTDVQVETLPIKFLRIFAAMLICSHTNRVPLLTGKSSSKVHELGCFKLTSCYVATLQGTNISHLGFPGG